MKVWSRNGIQKRYEGISETLTRSPKQTILKPWKLTLFLLAEEAALEL